jgi:hypothetical protein
MNYSLGNMLGGGMVAGLDPDAKSYINAVAATGVTVTQTQKNAINAFVESEKAASRWTLHKRLYLPIWSLASANAIDIVTRASGTFVNSPTHGAGFVQGNGSTSYFDAGISPSSAGFTSTNGSMFSLVYAADTRVDPRMMMGARDNNAPATGECSLYQSNATVLTTILGRVAAVPVASLTVIARTGILHSNRNAAQGLLLSHRRASVSRSVAATGTGAISTFNLSAMAITEGAVRALHTNARLGAYGFGLGLSSNAEVDAFTLNLKTLWETCTGLTIP